MSSRVSESTPSRFAFSWAALNLASLVAQRCWSLRQMGLKRWWEVVQASFAVADVEVPPNSAWLILVPC